MVACIIYICLFKKFQLSDELRYIFTYTIRNQ